MALEFPEPEPRPLAKVSPTLANDLLACGLRVAWRLDERFRGLRRPSPWTELGVVAHAVVEDVGKGLLNSSLSDEEARDALEAAWDRHLRHAEEGLIKAWAPASPPPPFEWPGYHLVRARTIRRALRLFEAAAPRTRVAAAGIEETLEDPETSLFGRPDRVEGEERDRAVVDLKTGLSQDGATEAQRRQLLLYAHLVGSATGDTPVRVAIEDPAGRRWEEPATRESIAAAVTEVLEARDAYESAAEAGSWQRLANPARETCRRCPYRLVCGEYWRTLDLSWGHGSVAGTITRSRLSPAGSIADLYAESPVDASGDGWVVSAMPEEVAMTDGWVAIVDAEITGTDRLLRWRWSTMARPL